MAVKTAIFYMQNMTILKMTIKTITFYM